jgi:hypothetical protein
MDQNSVWAQYLLAISLRRSIFLLNEFGMKDIPAYF